VVTTANALNISQAGIVGFNGTATFVGTAMTQYYTLTGGSANDTINQVAPSATSGVPFISQGSSAQPIYGTAVVAGGGTGAVSFNTNGVIISNTSGTGALAALSLSSGQVVIGGTTTPAAATLTGGTGISISNGNNSITINNTGAGFTWVDVTGGSATLAAQSGYIADKSTLTTLTLPTNNSLGDTILVVGKGTGGWKIVYTTGQNIIFGATTSTTTTGNIASNQAADCVTLVCTTASASAPIFTVTNSQGNISVT
jgi:hypothetical protein